MKDRGRRDGSLVPSWPGTVREGLDPPLLGRQFAYYAGQITDAHQENGKVKSAATTQLVSQIVLSDGRTLSYEHDAEERTNKVTDSLEGVTEYTYDAMGQLLTETHDDGHIRNIYSSKP